MNLKKREFSPWSMALNVVIFAKKKKKPTPIMPNRGYEGKVVIIYIADAVCCQDFNRCLDNHQLTYYVECRGVGQPLVYYTFGNSKTMQSIIGYARRSYNTLFKTAVKTCSLRWKSFVGSLDDQYCDHVLTSCSMNEFYDLVTAANQCEPVDVPCAHRKHAIPIAVADNSTIGGRYRRIVPYIIEDNDEDTKNNDTVCFCKCKCT